MASPYGKDDLIRRGSVNLHRDLNCRGDARRRPRRSGPFRTKHGLVYSQESERLLAEGQGK